MTVSSINVWMTIGVAALVTYTLRAGGLLLSDKLPRSRKFNQFMGALPGTILLSLVAPGVFSAGYWGLIAAVSTGFCAYKTGNLFLSMIIGILIVAVHRQMFL